MSRIIRVFLRKTSMTPIDSLAIINRGPDMFDEADEIHISVTFSWDLEQAEYLSKLWACVAPVKVGGPATGQRSEEFEPGKYIKTGCVITSRGCPNHCWFCDAWRREGPIREIEIKNGFNVLDDNLLACSDDHVKKVFEMLKNQKERPIFSGGLEAARLKQWHAKSLKALKPKRIYFAYDTDDDLEPLRCAAQLLFHAGFSPSSHVLCSYVLCGYPGDTMDFAENRMKTAFQIGFMPMAMLYKDKTGKAEINWKRFQRKWARPAIIYSGERETYDKRKADH